MLTKKYSLVGGVDLKFPKHLGEDNTHLDRRVYHDVVEERRLVASEMSEVIRLLILRVLNWP